MGVGRESSVETDERLERLPTDREAGDIEAVDRGALADDGRHGLSAVARLDFSEHGLILHVGKDAEGILARHIRGGEHAENPRLIRDEGAKIADGETCPRMRRADGAKPKRVLRGLVGAIGLAAVELGKAVKARHPRPYRDGACRRTRL